MKDRLAAKTTERVAELQVTDCYLVLNPIRHRTPTLFITEDRIRSLTRALQDIGADVHFMIYPKKHELKPFADKLIPLAETLHARSILLDLEENWSSSVLKNIELYLDQFEDAFLSSQVTVGIYGYGFLEPKVKPFARIVDYVTADAQDTSPTKSHRSWKNADPSDIVMILPAYKPHTVPSMANQLKETRTLTDPGISEIVYWWLTTLYSDNQPNEKGWFLRSIASRIRASERDLIPDWALEEKSIRNAFINNLNYSISLGWSKHMKDVLNLIGLMPWPSAREWVSSIKRWQRSHRISPAPGYIGPQTWTKMQTALGL